MGLLQEKEIRGYQIKNKGFVCPVCATDEEKSTESSIKAEDKIHNEDPMVCVRCQKKVK